LAGRYDRYQHSLARQRITRHQWEGAIMTAIVKFPCNATATASLTFSKEQRPMMPKATKKHITNRRAFLATTAVAVPAVAGGAVMALTSSADADLDPIFAAIENHQKLDKESLALEAASDKAGLGDAISAAENAAWKMAQTKPTTVAGAAALLAYITTGPITGLFELGETHWHETAFRGVVASLAKITRQSQRAA
jgi:hypothetical protein